MKPLARQIKVVDEAWGKVEKSKSFVIKSSGVSELLLNALILSMLHPEQGYISHGKAASVLGIH